MPGNDRFVLGTRDESKDSVSLNLQNVIHLLCASVRSVEALASSPALSPAFIACSMNSKKAGEAWERGYGSTIHLRRTHLETESNTTSTASSVQSMHALDTQYLSSGAKVELL